MKKISRKLRKRFERKKTLGEVLLRIARKTFRDGKDVAKRHDKYLCGRVA